MVAVALLPGAAIGVALAAPLAASAAGIVNGTGGWGANSSGQLGNASTTDSDVPVSNGLTQVQAVSAGAGFALALLDNGTVMAWGDNSEGQLGLDPTTTPYSDVPVAVSGLPGPVKAVSAGGGQSLALLKDGLVMAWGDNSNGQLGLDPTTTSYSDTPMAVSGVSSVTQIKAGGAFSLAVVRYGTVMAWGDNSEGQLGLDPTTTPYSDVPVPVSSDLRNDVVTVAAGSDFGLALMGGPLAGTVMAWGDNSDGQLGVDPTTTSYSATPVAVSGLSFVSAIAAGDAHGLALLPGGKVDAWGDNSNGQLGDGSSTDSYQPVMVVGLSKVAAIRAGNAFSVARLRNDTVAAWGDNSNGQLGNDTSTDSDTPVETVNLNGATSISAGSNFSLDMARQLAAAMPPRAQATARAGDAFSHTVKVRSLPNYSNISEVGAPPSGVAFIDNGNNTATLSGTPGAGSAGTYVLQITASNGLGSPVTQSFKLIVR